MTPTLRCAQGEGTRPDEEVRDALPEREGAEIVRGDTFFTFIVEYKGGTYISQVSGPSLAGAIAKWARTRTDRDLTTWDMRRDDLNELVKADAPVLLEGCRNIWCMSASTDEGLILVNIVATSTATAL